MLTEEALAAGGGNIACSSRDMTEHAKSESCGLNRGLSAGG